MTGPSSKDDKDFQHQGQAEEEKIEKIVKKNLEKLVENVKMGNASNVPNQPGPEAHVQQRFVHMPNATANPVAN